MKIFKFLFSLIVLLGVLHFLNYPSNVGEDSIPPLGHFFNPFDGFWQNAEAFEVVYEDEKMEVATMKGKVTIKFDERMVPHIFAENMEDAMFAQGYVVARFRLWQMDMLSRLSAGRLSEIMGERTLQVDKMQRRKGTLYGAQKANESWQKSPDTYRYIQAYADGINAWTESISKSQYPIEFKLLDYAPENWSTLKTALVKKYMDLTLCSAENDLESTNAMKVLGPKLFNKLYPEWNPKQKPVIPKGTEWNFPTLPPTEPERVEETIGGSYHQPFQKTERGIGSNNWAVAGSKTASGHPILCNDPHLQLALPSIWFEIQIHTPDANVYGVCIPGLPGVLSGFNEHIAWGVTNVGQDVVDWYEIKWNGNNRTSYHFDEGTKEASLVEEKYFIKNKADPVIDTVKWTVWGPIVYEQNEDEKRDFAMRWIAHDAPNPDDFMTFFGLNNGRNYQDYRKALTHFEFPAQNFAFAAKNGDIAMTVNGRFPVKSNQQGRFLLTGDKSENAWNGFIPKSQVPHVKNPGRGFVASANQHSTDPSYPYYYNSRGFDDYRGRYLVERLDEMNGITVDEMMKLQNSTHSLLAEEGLTLLLSSLNLAKLSEKERDIVNRMAVWDFKFEKEKVEPVIFDVWWEKFYELTFDEVLVWRDSMAILKPDNWRLVDLFESSPKDSIFDRMYTPEIEKASDLVHLSLKESLVELSENLIDPDFNWSTYKNTSIMHLSRIKPFSVMNIDVGGTGDALNAMKTNHGPSWRMVVELGDEVNGWGVYPGGQSGNPGSPFYLSGIEKWSRGEYNELFFMKDESDDKQGISLTIEMN